MRKEVKPFRSTAMTVIAHGMLHNLQAERTASSSRGHSKSSSATFHRHLHIENNILLLRAWRYPVEDRRPRLSRVAEGKPDRRGAYPPLDAVLFSLSPLP